MKPTKACLEKVHMFLHRHDTLIISQYSPHRLKGISSNAEVRQVYADASVPASNGWRQRNTN